MIMCYFVNVKVKNCQKFRDMEKFMNNFFKLIYSHNENVEAGLVIKLFHIVFKLLFLNS